jgi:hypothetical protein
MRLKPSIGVDQLRPSWAVEDDLEWFFNRAESDMGAQSNFQAVLGRHRPMTSEDMAEACHRHRRIRSRLKAIPDAEAGVLQAAYELRAWPVALYDKLGRLTGVVVRLACALDRWPDDRPSQQALEMVRAGWLLGQGLHPSNATLSRLRQEATVRLTRAHAAFSRVSVARRVR